MREQCIDLRSDTVTWPTEEMRRAMSEAEVGDDVYGDDPTVNRLEALAAAMTGKEAALFVPTGTMGNQIAVMTHTARGDEIIAAAGSHVIRNEGGAAARLSGVGYALADHPDGTVRPEDVRRLVRPRGNVHYPASSLLCVENALGNGDVVPLELWRETCGAAREHGLRIHMDGARLFHAALYLGVEAAALTETVDSVMFCVSKGLCAPVGSLLCGDAAFIGRARYTRKLMGGGMRQAGVLAAAGILALEKMTLRLGEDHDNARYLAEQLAAIPGIVVATERVKINMVFWRPDLPGFDPEGFCAFLQERGILASASYGEWRFVTHHGVDRAAIDTLVAAVREYVAAL